MNRRDVLASLASSCGAWAPAALAARPARATTGRRIGTLLREPDLEYLRRTLHEIGYEEGRNVEFVSRSAEGSPKELDIAARELVAARVEVVVTGVAEATQAARRVTATIPIVMFYAQAPVETGLVASLARPGGNVTGTTAAPLEIAAKAIELLRECVAQLRRVVVLAGRDSWSALYLRETERAARSLAIGFVGVRVETADELDIALAELERQPPDGIAVGIGVLRFYEQVVRFTARHRLPAIYAVIPAVTKYGGLMAYSTNYPALMTRTAAIIDRLLHGVKPSDIPVEEPARYLLAVNQKTARAMGLTVPRSILVRADLVVE
jgi:putative ABC transport system substrate-binding protein